MRLVRLLMMATVLLTMPGWAQAETPSALQQLSGSVQDVVACVSPTVVQVLVSSYGPVSHEPGNMDLVVGRQRSLGSGVVMSRDGYIITNAHVIENARHIDVVLPSLGPGLGEHLGGESGGRRHVPAQIVGVASELDLALLKIEADNLTPIELADYDQLRQGELVFALGSPEGLRNSVTMGIVSAVAQQPDPESPLVYVQTDASMNHGNSGGPLVDVSGRLVGVNTMILSDSGGSQGLGFAIPSPLVELAYTRLRQFGYLRRGEVGILLQTITEPLAAGLDLHQDWGAMISDVTPGTPAEKAGLARGDIVLAVDQKPMDAPPRVALELFKHSPGDVVTLRVLRGERPLDITLTVGERQQDLDRWRRQVEPEQTLIRPLGIHAVDLTGANAPSAMRLPYGVIVIAHTVDGMSRDDTGLMVGDAIHAINGSAVASVQQVRAVMAELHRDSPVVLEVERHGQFMYLAFTLEG